jgi:hypothetical protein
VNLNFFQRARAREVRKLSAPQVEMLACRLHWVFWISAGWKPARGQSASVTWRARNEVTKSMWRAVAEESMLGAEVL